MAEVNIKARSDSKIYSVASENLSLVLGDEVVFESDQCQEVATVVGSQKEVGVEIGSGALIIRRLSDKDRSTDESNKEEARHNLARCKEIILKHSLPMEVLDADLSLDRKKLTFYFSAPGRVDFRALVSELASTFQKLIRLQQIGARDRARYCGGYGRCGETFCCRRFLKGELDCVSIEMAQDQNLAQMGPNRVTGACGKLMCCLKYELGYYKDVKSALPPMWSTVKTAKGKGKVVGHNIVKKCYTVELEDRTRMEVSC
ncbi:MAG TPA: regulatory iron-sulfur-containing complex subunit RicT [bacterium]|nr:regulatory iron-sulfur-containing complex subunit RicT [bacterium]